MPFGYIPPADYLNLGGVIPDGVSLAVDDRGVLSVLTVPPSAASLELTDSITDLKHVSKISFTYMALGGTPTDALLQPVLATTVNPGIAQPDGNTCFVNEAGILSVFQASTQNRGIVQPDGTSITIDDDGTIHAVVPGLTVTDLISTNTGVTRIVVHAAHITGTSPSVSIFPDLATATTAGIVAPDEVTTYVDSLGRIGVFQATPSSRGIMRPDGTTATVDGMGTLSVPVGSTSNIGLLQPDGTSIHVTSGGVISASIPSALTVSGVSGSVAGVSSLHILAADVSGSSPNATVTPRLATPGSAGIVAPDNTTTSVDGAGHITALTATPSALGISRPDGSTLYVDGAGVLHVFQGNLLPPGSEGAIPVYKSTAWSLLLPGTKGYVVTSDGNDPYYDLARIAMAANGAAPTGTRHEVDLASASGNIVVGATDDGPSDAVHYDLDLSAAIKAILGTSTSTTIVSNANAVANSLWNGSGNNSPPSGWQNLTFDDSSWAPAIDFGAGTGNTPGSDDIWPTATPASASEQALTRQHFLLPAGSISSATILVFVDDYSLGVYINGTLLAGSIQSPGPIQGLLTLAVTPSLLTANGPNVIAVHGANYAGTAAHDANVSYTLTVNYAGKPAGAGTVTVERAGVFVGTEQAINFIPGPNVAITAVDTPGQNRVDVTISATAGGGGTGMATLYKVVVGALGQATISFPMIPAGYDSLKIIAQARGTNASVESVVLMQLNGDTGSNYDRIYVRGYNGNVSANEARGTTSAEVARISAANSTAGDASSFEVTLPNYTATTFRKDWYGLNHEQQDEASTDILWTGYGGQWRSKSAITAITLSLASGSFAAGSTFWLYGIAGTAGGASGVGNPGSMLAVEDTSGDTVTPASVILFSGATVSDAGNGQANVLIPQPVPFAFELTGGSTTIDFTGIPATARHLRIEGRVRDAVTSGSSGQQWSVVFNGIQTASYWADEVLSVEGDTVQRYSSGNALSEIILGGMESVGDGGLPTDSNVQHMVSFVIEIPYYALGRGYPSLHYRGAGASNTGQNAVQVDGGGQGSAFNNMVINRVTFLCAGGDSFHANSHITLYGYA